MDSIQDFLSKYQFDRRQSLDQNGFGSVYKAENTETGEELVVKNTEMHPRFDQHRLIQRYERAQELKHANLLPYLAAYRFEDKGLIQNFAVMPYIERLSLDLLDPETLTDEERRDWIEQILAGLDYLHKQGLVWQNLTASHILMDKTDEAYQLKFINYGEQDTLPLGLFTNYEHLAPEQFEKDYEPNKRTDFWALGVLIYWLFTGQKPFGQRSTRYPNANIKARILKGEIPDLIDEIPMPYRQIVRKCLTVDKNQRWANCTKIIEAISQNNTTFDAVPPKPKELPDAKRRIRRKPSKPINWGLVILFFALAAVLGYIVSYLK